MKRISYILELILLISLVLSSNTISSSLRTNQYIQYSNSIIASSNVLTISITSTKDSIGDATYCSSSTMLCNVRSAFKYCNLYSNSSTNTSCQIGTIISVLLLLSLSLIHI